MFYLIVLVFFSTFSIFVNHGSGIYRLFELESCEKKVMDDGV